jgi:ABC-type multidrug transport system fused ATPase/permease subunit
LSLKINKGEKLAIVGHTGAGKTSLAALVGRYYEFQGGSLLIDGQDIRDIQLESYRRHVGKVEQDVFLFPGTLFENITYGRQEATEEEVIVALRIVQAHEFIEALPNGIHTRIGERGKELSAGQRQLISFARAILLNPSILILDEATSSVDAYTEAMIQEALEEILKNRTAIIIAHRLSTIVGADRIIVMDHGRIVEEGTHEELLAKGSTYATLYNQYFVHQSWEWQLKQTRD